MIVPRFDLDASAERQRSNDVGRWLFIRRLAGEYCGEDGPACLDSVAQVRTDKVGDRLRPFLERLEKQSGGSGLILVWRLHQQFDPLLVRCLFLFRCASKAKVAERLLFVEPHATEERELGVHAMSQHHVTELVRENSRKAGLVRKRSEEHTSELQSRLHLVCRLLLEKKKKIIHSINLPAQEANYT